MFATVGDADARIARKECRLYKLFGTREQMKSAKNGGEPKRERLEG